MNEDATCRRLVYQDAQGEGGTHIYSEAVCGASIPRLTEGPCQRMVPGQSAPLACGQPRGDHGPVAHVYLGPLASECTAGHPQP